MAKKRNLFSSVPDTLGKGYWEKLVDLNSYRVVESSEINNYNFLHPTLKKKFHSGILASSGSDASVIMYSFTGIRKDGDYIDEEPFIALYDSGSLSASLCGYIHHADYEGRTTRLTQEMIAKIALSGSQYDFTFKRKPDPIIGSLEDLKKAGLLDGLENSWKIGEEKNKSE